MKRKGARWDRRALSIRQRDDYVCQICGEWGDEVDHIVPIKDGGAMWDGENLQVLCSACHVKKTRFSWGKFASGTDEWYDEWRRLRKEIADGRGG